MRHTKVNHLFVFLAITSLCLIAPNRSQAICKGVADYTTLQQWSDSGNAALILQTIRGEINFIVVDGNRGTAVTFQFQESNGESVRPDIADCSKNMENLNSLLIKLGMKRVPVGLEQCQSRTSKRSDHLNFGRTLKVLRGATFSSNKKIKIDGTDWPCGSSAVIYYQSPTTHSYVEIWRADPPFAQ